MLSKGRQRVWGEAAAVKQTQLSRATEESLQVSVALGAPGGLTYKGNLRKHVHDTSSLCNLLPAYHALQHLLK